MQAVEIDNLISKGSFFIYDLDGLKAHADSMVKSARENNITLWYACKANPASAVIETLKNSQLRFDVASEGELMQVIKMGVLGENILMTGPAKSEKLLRLGLQHRVGVFVIESPTQLFLLQKLVVEYNYQPQVLLRLQLQWDDAESNMLGGNKITPFGMDIATAKQLLKEMKLSLLGFHVFQWGNILSVERLGAIWQRTIDLCKTVTENFKVMDVGGGLGIPYHGENPLSWQAVVAKINQIKAHNNIHEFWLELGRYAGGPFGRYVTKVVDRKTVYGNQMLVLEGGINHLLKSALVGGSYPAALLRHSERAHAKFSVHGPLCTALDFLGEYEFPDDVAVGDAIVFTQTGAYGFTQSMPFFLCHNLAGEAIVKNQQLTIIREPEGALTWLK